MDKFTKLLIIISKRQDLFMIFIVLVAVGMMILPIPELLLDTVIAINITTSIAILVTAFYLKSAAHLTTFPSILLVTTLMRLSASVASTRLILLYGDAGHIITAFGNFVVGGNLVVGLVVFLILTIVNFLVITKGSERVAEVSARFTLDAMPGKQMSIDAELKSGDIDKTEAHRRREELATESQFFGAMDGAMKFVKGDAIAGIIILMVNIIGGILVGTMMMGLPAGEALEKFTVLSVGDGLVAQIPSILISIASGLVITRISNSKSRDIGADIMREILQNNNTNRILATVLLGMAIVPGFPSGIFLTMSIMLWLLSFKPQLHEFFHKKIMKVEEYQPPVSKEDDVLEEKIAPGEAKIDVTFNYKLAKTINSDALIRELRIRRKALIKEYGINIPNIAGVSNSRTLRDNFFTVNLDGVPVSEGELNPEKLMVRAEHEILDVAQIPCEMAPPTLGPVRHYFVASEYKEKLNEIGVKFYTSIDTLIEKVIEAIRNNLSSFMSLQEVQEWINEAGRAFPDLVNEIRQVIQPQKMTEVFKRLLADHISLASRRPLLEAITNWASKEEDPAMLAELIRVSLRRQICFACANQSKVIVAAIFDPSVEEVIRQSVRRTNLGDFLALEQPMSEKILGHIKQINREPRFMSPLPVILCSIDIRRFVRGFLIKHGIDIPILSHQDIAEDFTVQVIYAIK
jgi:type III secretion protein V